MIQEPVEPIEGKEKTSFKERKIFHVLVAILLLWIVFYFLPPFSTVETPYDHLERPLVIAHQGGEHLAPSNTLTAFLQAMELGVDVIELDIHMTKDGHLVAIHDDTVDRTTDGTGRVNDLTLEEIKSLDAGYYFQDDKGEHPYRGQGIEIPTLEEIFNAIPNMKWNIEIKDTNNPELHDEIVKRFWQIIQDYGLEKDVLIASFNHEIIKKVQEVSRGEAFVSG